MSASATAEDPLETKIVEDAPVTKIVATMLRYATEGNASDVHVEPLKDKIRVRFRVDGVLNTSLLLPVSVHSAVIARIKILSNMKLDEKRKPQDGRFSAKIDGRKIDFRVSTFPTYHGEKVVMRILDQEKGVQTLDKIGLSETNLSYIRDAIKRPYGMILISGPTGSGKTTTLYSMLGEINKEELNVLSLEDPIEYNIDGVSQSQVFTDIGYTFATGLRTTLRQDPDVIMVGEIRDKETAQLAVQAALTGHLVLATIHTNNSVGVIPRLIDMGVDPYLIAPTLILTMAQRLTKTLYPGTGKAIPVDGSIKAELDREFADLPDEYRQKLPKFENVYEPESTPECPTGTKGRIAVFEAFKMNKDIEKIILSNPTETAIFETLRKKGMLTMKEDAIIKALNRQIPWSSVDELGTMEEDV
jgi:type IV pilus assembly protein PilB